jgi:hypothetical protein
VAATTHPKISRARRAPIVAEWLDAKLAELERLVEEGETLEAVSRLSTMVRAPKRAGAPTRLDREQQVEHLGGIATDPSRGA